VTGVTMLTVNADGHAVMGRMHRLGDEKRGRDPAAGRLR
jgi:hypothetical protein